MLSRGRIWGDAEKKSNGLLIESRIAPAPGSGGRLKNYLLFGEFVATFLGYEIIVYTSPHGHLHGRFRHHHLCRQLRRMHGWGKERKSQDRRGRPELSSAQKDHREAVTLAASFFLGANSGYRPTPGLRRRVAVQGSNSLPRVAGVSVPKFTPVECFFLKSVKSSRACLNLAA